MMPDRNRNANPRPQSPRGVRLRSAILPGMVQAREQSALSVRTADASVPAREVLDIEADAVRVLKTRIAGGFDPAVRAL
jgi:hypothetical protein